MAYVIVEMQTNETGATAVLTQTAADRNHAKSIYHQVLAAAAVSTVPVHSCALLTEEGVEMVYESFTHAEGE